MSALYNVVGTAVPESLLSDPNGAMKIAVGLTPNKGVVKRGSILYKNGATWEFATAANLDGTKQVAILNTEVDTAANTTIAEDADAYVAGRFVGAKLLVSGGTLTEAIKLVLRNQGIIVDPIAE